MYVDPCNRKINYMLLNKICLVASHHHLLIYLPSLGIDFKASNFSLFFRAAVKFQKWRGFKAFTDRPNLVIMWNNVFWKGPRAYYLTGWKPLRWATLPTWPLCKQLFDVLFFLLWFSLPTQIPVIIIISCPRISRRSVHPRLTAYAYERDSGTVRARLEHHSGETDL